MKTSEMNARQKKAFYNIYHASQWLLGGLENSLLDYPEASVEHQIAYATLHNHDSLVTQLYDMAISEVYMDGMCDFSKNAEAYLKDIRFCGKDWLMERCEARIKKEGY